MWRLSLRPCHEHPGSFRGARAGYVNDHFDTSKLNARFEKDRQRRVATLIATRDIRCGEEIYASYGESYWRARGVDPETGKPLPLETST